MNFIRDHRRQSTIIKENYRVAKYCTGNFSYVGK